jgi:polyisoprenyl-teichoic acid--peptidoglycan teichoic acid transferase
MVKIVRENEYNLWYKKWQTYVFAVLFLFIVIPVIFVITATNNFTVSNGDIETSVDEPWWGNIASLFKLNSYAIEAYEDPYPLPEEEPNRYDVLIMGMRGEDEEIQDGKWLTDTMILVSFDRNTGRASMVSIPRDLYVDIFVPEFSHAFHLKGKMNEVYIRGAANGGGIKLTKQVVSKITGVYVDKAVVFDFQAFKDIVDTLGGVDIHLSQPFVEPEQWGYPFELPEGDNHLDGQDALYYVRSRFSTSDFDRARRQQQVIKAMKNRAFNLGVLANPVTVSGLFNDLRGNVRTDLQLWEIKDAVTIANSIGDSSVSAHVLTTENVLYETILDDIGYVLLPRADTFDTLRTYFKTTF